ncbi:MAG: RCC1 domain-containing protein [Byssovorax sp.]
MNVVGLSSGVRAMAVADAFTCAVTSVGAVERWGGNFLGQLGDGSDVDRPLPAEAMGLSAGSGAVAISAGSGHTCVSTEGGTITCWGPDFTINSSPSSFNTVPTQVMGL